MVHVNCSGLNECQEDLKEIYASLVSLYEELLDIQKKLSKEDGGVRGLNICCERTEQHISQIADLGLAMDTIRNIYSMTEERIIDFGETAPQASRKPGMAYIDLTDVAALLGELSYSFQGGK